MANRFSQPAARRFAPQSAPGRHLPPTHQMQAPLYDEGFTIPSASLYSLAAQQDAIAMDQEAERPAVLQHGPNSHGSTRETFFRPYQAGPLHSHQGPSSSHQFLYGPPAGKMQPVQAVQPIPQHVPRAQQAVMQRQHFFPVQTHASAITPSEHSSSPSPAYRGWDGVGGGDRNTPGRSSGSELTLGLETDAFSSLGVQNPSVRTAYNRPNATHAAASTPQQRQPLRLLPQEQPMYPEEPSPTQKASPRPTMHSKPGGVRLKPVTALPDMWRSIYKFPVFNAVQSTCFDSVYQSSRNVVVSAPTGSGKTVVFELAIIRMLQSSNTSAKAVYLAPTKALCSERYKDWSTRLQPLGCIVMEITGDTNFSGLSAAKHARVIVTTPEKWDSLTRRWTDHDKILSNLALLLIDEVHILHEKGRGARLEVIVSRMKNYGQQIRFVAVSATVPNLEDVAEWISRNSAVPPNPKASEQGVPASFADLFRFGEEFRPCHLSKFVYGYPKLKDDFAFTASLNKHLLGLVQEHAKAKPCLIFVSTRKGTVQAADAVAKQLAGLEQAREPLPWSKPEAPLRFQDPKLEELATSGIAFHHAGMVLDDRRAVEQAFLSGSIKVLCATTTLATGVNLPAYCVIIRGTKQYAGGGWAEISDLDFVQMIGRAGRPQFDAEGVAVVMTQNDQKQHYTELASGNTVIESSLAAELVEHINAELVLRGTSSKQAIEQWIEGTFLHVRLLKNPAWYNLDETAASKTSKEVMQSIVQDALNQLDQHDLATASGKSADELAATDFGDILAKYFLSFKTMLLLLQAPHNATIKELLDLMTEAEEFKDIRMRQGEKSLFVTLCKNEEIRFPPAKVNGVKDKISLLMQAVLAGLSLQDCLGSKTLGYSPTLDAFTIFRHAPRVVKAMFDIFLAKGHGQALQNAFILLRSINGRSWEGKPAVLRQLEGVGEKIFKILSGAGLLTVSDVASTDPRRIEMLLNRNPPFGDKIVNQAKAFPHFHLDVEQVAEVIQDDGVQLTVKVKVGLQDTGVKVKTNRKESGAALAVCVLTMSSDLTLFDFRKMPLKKLCVDKEFKIKCKLEKPSQRIIVTAACDEIAGSAVRSELRHNLPASSFPEISVLGKTAEDLDKERALQELEECIDFFGTDDDLDLDLDSVAGRSSIPPPPKSITSAPPPLKCVDVEDDAESDPEPERLPNGNYKCLHSCKSSCRHLCCREGMERPPLKKKKKAASALKATAEQPTTPTLLERLRQTDVNAQLAKERKQKTALPVNAARSGSGSYAGAERESSKLSTKERIEFPLKSRNEAVLSDDDDDDELPLLLSRKRKYNVNWNAFEDVDDEFPTDGIKPSPATQKKKRTKVSFSKYIDDEAGEDNRPEHAVKGKDKAKGPRVTRRKEDAGNSYFSEDEDAGSLVDFVVGDHIDPTIDFSEDDLTLPQNHDDERYGEEVSRGDLVDCGLDDLAHLFTDSEPEDGPLLDREGVRDPPKTSSRVPNSPTEDMSAGLAFAAGSDDGFPLFLSEDWVPGSEIDIAAPSSEPRRAVPASVDSGIDLAFLDDESPADITAAVPGRDDEDAPDDQDVVNEDMALGVRDGVSPVPSLPERRQDVASGSKVWKSSRVDPQQQPSKVTNSVSPVPSLPMHHRQDTASNHKAIVEPLRVEAQQQSKATPVVPDRPAVRRPTFADRMLAKLQQARLNDTSQKPSTAAAAVTAAAQVAQPSSSTSRMVDTIQPAEEPAQQQQEAVRAAPIAAPSIPGDEETWGDWDLLKG